MSEKRMFSKSIIDSDLFLDMPMTTQCLYFHLNMRADDDGFINNPKKIIRMIGCSEDDLKLLIAKNYLITFDSGVIVIKHWKIHNYIQKDRYKETIYQDEKKLLTTDKSKAYEVGQIGMDTKCIQNVSTLDTQIRLDKIRLDKNRLVYMLPSKEGSYLPTDKFLTELKDVYSKLDIEQEFKKMRLWLESNPKKQKTIKGMNKFINSWLSRTEIPKHKKTYEEEVEEWLNEQD